MLSRVKAILKDYGFVLYTKPYQLNIVGLRGRSTAPNNFDDEIHVFYMKTDGKWNYHIYSATTDPGTYWLNNPSYEQGTAILAQGQYVNAYTIGKHKGLYDALVQVHPVTVIRDYNRNAVLDFNNGQKQTGLFGINVHRAESNGTTRFIGKYSAGCQVFQNAADFTEFMALARQHEKLYGNRFTYTLVDFRAMRRVAWRRVLAASTVTACLAIGWILTNER